MGALGVALGSFGSPTLSEAAPGVDQGPSLSPGSTAQNIFTDGMSVLNTVLGYNVKQNQINHGQVPNSGYSGGGQPVGAAWYSGLMSGSGLALVIVFVLVLVFLFRK